MKQCEHGIRCEHKRPRSASRGRALQKGAPPALGQLGEGEPETGLGLAGWRAGESAQVTRTSQRANRESMSTFTTASE